MSVANILDPATGLIKDEYARGSTVIPNQVIPISPAATQTVLAGAANATFAATNTACSTDQVWSISGLYSIRSNAPSVGGSNMAIYFSFNGGPAGNLKLFEVPETTTPQIGVFSLIVKVPAGGNTSFSIQIGRGSVANVGTINCSLTNVFITEVQP